MLNIPAICIGAYYDMNLNDQWDDNEPPVGGVAFIFVNSDGVYEHRYESTTQHSPHCIDDITKGRYRLFVDSYDHINVSKQDVIVDVRKNSTLHIVAGRTLSLQVVKATTPRPLLLVTALAIIVGAGLWMWRTIFTKRLK